MYREPTIFSSETMPLLLDTERKIDGRWVPARPISFQRPWVMSLAHRARLAWGVFTGRFDVLNWGKQP